MLFQGKIDFINETQYFLAQEFDREENFKFEYDLEL